MPSALFQLSRSWDDQQITHKIHSMMRGVAPALREASVLTAAELASNAIRFGDPLRRPVASIAVNVTDESIVIESESGLSDPYYAQSIKSELAEIKLAPDPLALYAKRMEVRLDEQPDGKLGLLRIVCEGEFDVESELDGSTLRIRAKRCI